MLVSKEFKFEAAHRLPNYRGKCEKLHGHSWKVLLTVEAAVNPADGLAIDFLEIQRVVHQKCIDVLDHSYLNDFMEHPSAENVARWIWEQVADALPVKEIKVWETEDALVTYRGPEAEESMRLWSSLALVNPSRPKSAYAPSSLANPDLRGSGRRL